MQLENFTKRDRILMRTTIGLRYETTPDQLRFVLAELKRLLIKHPKVDLDPARVRFVGFGAYSLDIELYAYVLTNDWNDFLGIREDIFLRMIGVVSESGAQFAFPSQVNYLGRDSPTDTEKSTAAEAAVAQWRSQNELPFPEFSDSEVGRLEAQLEYPPAGACLQPGESGKPAVGAETDDGAR
jgi:small-conductance mechanosensitive channel